MISIPRSWFHPSFADHHNGTAAGSWKNRRSLGLKAFHADIGFDCRVGRWQACTGCSYDELGAQRGTCSGKWGRGWLPRFFAVSAVNEEIGLGGVEWRKTRGMNRVRDSLRCVTLVSLLCSGELYRERNSNLGYTISAGLLGLRRRSWY